MVKSKKKAKKVAKKKAKSVTKKRVVKKTKRSKSVKKVRAKAKGEKVIAKVEHFFSKILVAAFKLKAPLSVGEVIHIKGHTTDFTQRIDSIQIEHQSVSKAKRGQDIGIRVKGKVRQGDTVFLATNQSVSVQQPIFSKPLNSQPKPPPQISKPKPDPAPSPKKTGYGETKFLSF